jgi:hypothetical protein
LSSLQSDFLLAIRLERRAAAANAGHAHIKGRENARTDFSRPSVYGAVILVVASCSFVSPVNCRHAEKPGFFESNVAFGNTARFVVGVYSLPLLSSGRCALLNIKHSPASREGDLCTSEHDKAPRRTGLFFIWYSEVANYIRGDNA